MDMSLSGDTSFVAVEGAGSFCGPAPTQKRIPGSPDREFELELLRLV